MPRKKSPTTNYFNEQTEEAVCIYLNSDCQIEREKAFRLIYPAISKIAEVWYHKTKFNYSDDDREDVMANCVAWIVEKMPKFKCGQGTKAFSYFTVTARFYYIQLNNKNYTYFKRNVPISDMGEYWDVENTDRLDTIKSEKAKLFYDFLAYCEHNLEKMFIPRYYPHARVILDTLSNFEQIEDFRRRKILQVIFKNGDMDDYGKSTVTKIINIMIAHLNLFKKRWETGDESLELCTKYYLTESEKKKVRETVVPGTKNNGTANLAREFGVDVKVVVDYLKTI